MKIGGKSEFFCWEEDEMMGSSSPATIFLLHTLLHQLPFATCPWFSTKNRTPLTLTASTTFPFWALALLLPCDLYRANHPINCRFLLCSARSLFASDYQQFTFLVGTLRWR